MATSGTIATTIINTAAVIEHALLRVKVPPEAQTPEIVKRASEDLYMLLLNLSNAGLNLWCVDKGFIGLAQGQAVYNMPAGTLDVLNVIHSQPTIATSVFAAITNGGQATVTSSTVIRIGWKLSSSYVGTVSVNGAVTLASQSYLSGVWYYADLPTATTGTAFTVTGASMPVSDIRVITDLYDLPVTVWNRDTYSAINNKSKQAHPATNYFWEKKIVPTLTLWPVPDADTNHLTIYRHRQVQDIGTLTQQLEIPARWYEGIVWQLAARLGFELPGVDPQHLQLVLQMTDKYLFEAEASESDGAPIYLTPGIGVYTR